VTLGGRYRVERELGHGGMAKVFLGTDTVLGRTVAIKLLAPQFADDDGFVQRFRREAQAAARIGHPHIVSVFDTGSDDGVHYIVMEYVEGRTLADFLAGGGRIMPDRAIDIAEDVLTALEAAHAQGVIHRDIKPGNIMLSPKGQVKVTDFGIARVTTTADTVAQTAAILGTASYLSPEQAQGQPVDGRSDIYSLGCVLYEMVTGRPPFLGDSPVSVASKQVLEQPIPPSNLNGDVTPELDAVILRALAKNPANRYQSAEEMRADLDRVRRGLPVEATPLLAAGATQVLDRPQPTQVLPPPEPERKRGAWVPIAVTLVLIGLLGLLLWFLATTFLSDDGQQTGVQVSVPPVVGESRAEAERILEEADLVPVIERRVAATDDSQEPGTVVAQDPEEGTEVERGSIVNLTIVAQPDLIAIPDLEGSSLEEAQDALLELGLEPAGPEVEASDTVGEGLVTRTDPAVGEELEEGTPVTIFVSSGPDQVSVPLVTCQSFGSAQNEIERAGLTPVISDQTVAENSQCPLGNKVAAQDPPSGTQVAPGSPVTLFQGEEPPATGPTGPTGETGDD
jgi:serine/threonine-protein kinase